MFSHKSTQTDVANVPRRIFFMALIIIILGFVAGAARLPELAIILIVFGLIAGFTAYGLRAGDDG